MCLAFITLLIIIISFNPLLLANRKQTNPDLANQIDEIAYQVCRMGVTESVKLEVSKLLLNARSAPDYANAVMYLESARNLLEQGHKEGNKDGRP